MPPTPEKTPALCQFLGAYLHQDWPIEFDDEWAALDRFIEESAELASHLPIEIESALGEHHAESDLRAFLVAQGCNYVPDPDKGGYRGWLTEIARRVEATLARDNRS
ncbi:hypothetical protein GCM10027601_04410 [Nocardioides ungokensis]